MSTSVARSQEEVLASTISIPENVVFRAFAAETVVLNVQTGKYFGLNPTGGHMLEVLKTLPSVGAAAERLAQEYDIPLETIQADLCAFCRGLEERGLIELKTGS